jgi:hypothetical protein
VAALVALPHEVFVLPRALPPFLSIEVGEDAQFGIVNCFAHWNTFVKIRILRFAQNDIGAGVAIAKVA